MTAACNSKTSPCMQALELLSCCTSRILFGIQIEETQRKDIYHCSESNMVMPMIYFLNVPFYEGSYLSMRCLSPKSNMSQQDLGRENPQGL